MIISLDEAKKFNPNVTQEDLDGIEMMIRNLTHNHFHNRNGRFEIVEFAKGSLKVERPVEGLRIGSTVEINHSKFNDGLMLVTGIDGDVIKLATEHLVPEVVEPRRGTAVTLVEYPVDIYRGVTKLLAYDAKMADKVGIHRESISRWTITYNSVGAGESEGGYPLQLMDFINSHRKLRW